MTSISTSSSCPPKSTVKECEAVEDAGNSDTSPCSLSSMSSVSSPSSQSSSPEMKVRYKKQLMLNKVKCKQIRRTQRSNRERREMNCNDALEASLPKFNWLEEKIQSQTSSSDNQPEVPPSPPVRRRGRPRKNPAAKASEHEQQQPRRRKRRKSRKRKLCPEFVEEVATKSAKLVPEDTPAPLEPPPKSPTPPPPPPASSTTIVIVKPLKKRDFSWLLIPSSPAPNSPPLDQSESHCSNSTPTEGEGMSPTVTETDKMNLQTSHNLEEPWSQTQPLATPPQPPGIPACLLPTPDPMFNPAWNGPSLPMYPSAVENNIARQLYWQDIAMRTMWPPGMALTPNLSYFTPHVWPLTVFAEEYSESPHSTTKVLPHRPVPIRCSPQFPVPFELEADSSYSLSMYHPPSSIR